MPDDQRVIVVVGQGSESGTPDRCALHLALNVMAESTADAFSRVAALANRVVDALRQRGVPEHDMQTQTVSLQDFFDQKEQKVTARVGTFALQVTVPVGEVGPHLGAVADVAGDSLQVRGLVLTCPTLNRFSPPHAVAPSKMLGPVPCSSPRLLSFGWDRFSRSRRALVEACGSARRR